MSSVIGPEVSTSHQRQNLRKLTGRVGMPFQIHLWEDRTRGELWVPSYDPAGLVLVGDDYLRIASENAVDSGQRTFEFKPVTSGSHRILFEKRLGWKFTAEARHVYEVTVSGSLPDGAR